MPDQIQDSFILFRKPEKWHSYIQAPGVVVDCVWLGLLRLYPHYDRQLAPNALQENQGRGRCECVSVSAVPVN